MVTERRGPRVFIDPEHRSLFGKARKVPWLTETAPDGELAGAYQQHVVALAVAQALREGGRTIEQLAMETGLGVETLRRKLRGEVWMSLSDLGTLEAAIPEVHTARKQADLFPY